MAESFKKLYQGQPNNTATTLFTVAANHTYIVSHIRVTNPDTSSHTIKFWHAGTTDPYVVIPTLTLQAGEFYTDTDGFVCEAGETFSAIADTSSKVTVTIYGLDVS